MSDPRVINSDIRRDSGWASQSSGLAGGRGLFRIIRAGVGGCVGWGQVVGQCVISWPQQRAQNRGTESAGRLLLLGSWIPLRTVNLSSQTVQYCESL